MKRPKPPSTKPPHDAAVIAAATTNRQLARTRRCITTVLLVRTAGDLIVRPAGGASSPKRGIRQRQRPRRKLFAQRRSPETTLDKESEEPLAVAPDRRDGGESRYEAQERKAHAPVNHRRSPSLDASGLIVRATSRYGIPEKEDRGGGALSRRPRGRHARPRPHAKLRRAQPPRLDRTEYRRSARARRAPRPARAPRGRRARTSSRHTRRRRR